MADARAGHEAKIHALGREIGGEMQDARPGIFDREFWANKLLDWAMDDPTFKVDLFRLVDVLPNLRTTSQLQQHMDEYLHRPGRELPASLETALRLSQGAVTGRLAASALRAGITEMAHRFIVGHTPQDALKPVRRLHKDGFLHTVDLLGEATLSNREADSYQRRYLDLIRALAEEVKDWHGADPRPQANVSIKLSALNPHLDAADTDGSVARVLRRLMPLLEAARAAGVFVNIDTEQYALHDITYRAFEEAASSQALREWSQLGIVVQAYCVYADDYLARVHALARRRGAPLTIRLVKGAYWDYEIAQAQQHGHRVPVYTQKAETDAHFERQTTWLMERARELVPAIATHNLRSIAHTLAQAGALGIARDTFEFQMLYGMAEPLRNALRRRGCPVRVYCPVGELLPGMAYLVRRLLENTANEGFLRLNYHEHADLDTLLADPARLVTAKRSPSQAGFRNSAHADFVQTDVRERHATAVREFPARFPLDVPAVVDGKEYRENALYQREDPSMPGRVVAHVHLAHEQLAGHAVGIAAIAWPAWRDLPLPERANLLKNLAGRLEADRMHLAALQMYECGKPMREADADVAEAIDFCRYYALRAPIELGPERLDGAYGEINDLFYEGRGVAVIIAPWNFPLAIITGMATAALVAGNTVVLKPATQSAATGYALYRHLMAAGFSADVVQFLPGDGHTVGNALVKHPDVAQIAFTGSKAVGLGIIERAGKTHPGQRQVKRVVCEMGGKNAVIVDADADLDEALAGILAGAFGYAGQKCSAVSRAIVVGDAYAPLAERLVAGCESLVVAPASDPACQVPPVIDEKACARLRAVVADPGVGARRLYTGTTPDRGAFVPVTVFEVNDPDHRLMQEELFGPVLTLMRAPAFEAALDIALNSQFALTGGVYTRQPSHLDLARARFRTGNLYINRGITGAMVGRQAFGGFHMSGTGTKAGGPGYLRHFADPRCITENTMRRGFAPDEE